MNQDVPKELVLLTRAHRELAEARTVKDFKAIRDKAEAARVYAKSALLGREIQLYAAELKLECERRAGEVLQEAELTKGGRPGRGNRSHVATSLEELGINKSQSSRWQMEAEVPEEEFRRYLADSRKQRREPTSQGLLKLARQYKEGNFTIIDAPVTKRPHKRRNKSAVIEDARPVEPDDSSDKDDAWLADLQNHHIQLSKLLSDYCAGGLTKSDSAKRRYVAQLLTEMGELLKNVRRTR